MPDSSSHELRANNRESPSAIVQEGLERVTRAMMGSTAFLGDGDLVVELMGNPERLKVEVPELVNDFFAKDASGSKISEAEVSEIASRFIETMPSVLEQMRQETEDSLEKNFMSRYYDSLPTGEGQRPMVSLTEPSGARVRAGDKEEIMSEVMTGFASKNPLKTNKYNFSVQNLEFLRPKLEALVEQLLLDYEAQK